MKVLAPGQKSAWIAFAVSFVPFLLYMIPPIDAAITASLIATSDGNPSNSGWAMFLAFGMPGVFFSQRSSAF